MIMPEPITIEWVDGEFVVTQGDRVSGSMTWHELVGHIAELTHPHVPRPRLGMHTPEQRERIAAFRERQRLLNQPPLPV